MTYATRADMVSRFGEDEVRLMTDIAPIRADAIVDSVLDQALADASAEIDGYLAGRYTLPLTTVPAILTRTCCDVARYFLQTQEAGPQVKARYEAATKWLMAVARGDIVLGIDAAGETPDAAGNTVEFFTGGKDFERGAMAGSDESGIYGFRP
jgi:phage gp36-like protein